MTAAPWPQRALSWLWPAMPDEAAAPNAVARRRALDAALLSRALADEAMSRVPALEGPSPEGTARRVAAGLLRESLRHGLRAHGESGSQDAMLSSLGVSDDVLDDPPGDDDALEARCVALRAAVDRVLAGPERELASASRRWSLRVTRVGLAAAAVAAVAVAAPKAARRMRTDLAPAAPWRASSTQNGYPTQGIGFHPREGEANIFFQTDVEPAPWIEFDLGVARRVTMVSLQNRLDCCQDWSVPLTVELSADRARWTEVARRVEPFYFWDATFPESRARYVRLRVPRMTALHLGRVSIR